MKLRLAPLLSAAAVAMWMNCHAQSNLFVTNVGYSINATSIAPTKIVIEEFGSFWTSHKFRHVDEIVHPEFSLGSLSAHQEDYWTDSAGQNLTDPARADRDDDKLHHRTVVFLGRPPGPYLIVPLSLTWTAAVAGFVVALLCFLALWAARRWRDRRQQSLVDDTTPSDSAPR